MVDVPYRSLLAPEARTRFGGRLKLPESPGLYAWWEVRDPRESTDPDASAAAGRSSAVYSLFGGKPQLLAAIVDYGFRSFRNSQVVATREGLRGLGVACREWALGHQSLYRLMFGGVQAAYADCRPDPEAAADAMGPLRAVVAAAQSAGLLAPAPLDMVAPAIWGEVHGMVSLELAQVGPTDMDWAGAYDAALDAVARGWAAAQNRFEARGKTS